MLTVTPRDQPDGVRGVQALCDEHGRRHSAAMREAAPDLKAATGSTEPTNNRTAEFP